MWPAYFILERAGDRAERYFKEAFIASNASLSGGKSFLTALQIIAASTNNSGINALIFVAENIADTCDVLPTHAIVLRLQIAAEMTTGFGDYFNSAFDSRAQDPRALVVTKGLSSDGFFYFSNALEHVVDTQQR
jgi:hypothetical protein